MEFIIVRFIGKWLVVSAVTLHGCAFVDNRERSMTQDAPTSEVKALKSTTSPGYPYPPEDLWRRLVDVIRTPPDELTHHKLGHIWGVEFDEDKMLWYGDKALQKYFLLSTSDIKNIEAFPFHQISLTQGDPDLSATVRRRHMVFRFVPFEHKYLGTSEIYCIKPKFPDLEVLGYRYDKFHSNMPQRPDSNGNMPRISYRTEIFVGAAHRGSIGFKHINLEVYPNGCLVGILYFNSPAY